MAIGTEYRTLAAQALFGSFRSPLVPATLWLGWHSTSGAEFPAERVAVENTDDVWGPTGAGVANIVPIDGGTAGAWIIGGLGLYTDDVDGTLIFSASLPSPLTTEADDVLTIDVGGLTVGVA